MHIARAALLSVMLVSSVAAQDSSYVVLEEGKIAPFWTVAEKGEAVHFPRELVKNHVEGCLAVGFSVESDGHTANVMVVRSAFSERATKGNIAEIESRVRRNLATTRYSATSANSDHKAVYTYSTYGFSLVSAPATKLEGERRADAVSANCKISDFPGAVARGDLKKTSEAR